MNRTPEDSERKDAPDEESFAGRVSDLGADGNPFEQGTGDPTGVGTVETPNVDGGRSDAEPWALHDTAPDTRASDPLSAAYQSKETVTNDAVAGETVEDGAGDGNYGRGRDPNPDGPDFIEDADEDGDVDIDDLGAAMPGAGRMNEDPDDPNASDPDLRPGGPAPLP